MTDQNKNTNEIEMDDDIKAEDDSGGDTGSFGLQPQDDGSKSEDGGESNNGIVIPKSKAVLMKKLLRNIGDNINQLLKLLGGEDEAEEEKIKIGQLSEEGFKPSEAEGEAKIIEGVFDGENMIGSEGKVYSVPANYASKSKIVEGDIMKLTITANGTFIYKQIGPIERTRVAGKLEKADENVYFVAADGKRWRVLTASVTYFRGEAGDEVVIMIPRTGESKWAAVENIIKSPIDANL